MAYWLFSLRTNLQKLQNGNGHGNILQSWGLRDKPPKGSSA